MDSVGLRIAMCLSLAKYLLTAMAYASLKTWSEQRDCAASVSCSSRHSTMSEVDSIGKAMAEVDRAVQERMCAHDRLILAASPLNRSWYTCCHSLALAQGKMLDPPRVAAIFLACCDIATK